MNKKLLITIGITILVLALGTLVYFFFIKDSNPGLTINPGSNSPFGQEGEGGGNNRPVSVNNGGSNQQGSQSFGNLTKISGSQISGAIILTTASSSFVRYVDRADGHVYEFNLQTSASTQLTNTTIPKIYSALWFPNGKSFIGTYEKGRGVETFIGTITAPKASTSTAESVGDLLVKFLPGNIVAAAISSAGDKIFYLEESEDGATGVIATATGDKPNRIWDSAITDWTVSWPKSDTLLLAPKASKDATGFVYTLSTTGSISRLLGEKRGLSAIANADLSKVFYSENTGSIKSAFYLTKEKADLPSPFITISEKCAWNKKVAVEILCAVPNTVSRSMPDSWYQGTETTSDTIWLYNTATDQASQIAVLDTGEGLDVEELQVSQNADYLIFKNKKDSTLWVLKLGSN